MNCRNDRADWLQRMMNCMIIESIIIENMMIEEMLVWVRSEWLMSTDQLIDWSDLSRSTVK
jgi:hypothetical protein